MSILKQISIGILVALSFQSAANACGDDQRGNGGYTTRTSYPNYGNYNNVGTSVTNLTRIIQNMRNNSRTNRTTYRTPTYTPPVTYANLTQQQQMLSRYKMRPLYEWDRFPGHSLFLDSKGGRWEFDAQGNYVSYFPQYEQLKFGRVDRRDDDDD